MRYAVALPTGGECGDVGGEQIHAIAAAGADWWVEWIAPADRATMTGAVERGPLRD